MKKIGLIVFLKTILVFNFCYGNSFHENLMKVGINSTSEWSGCPRIKNIPVVARDEEYIQVLEDGWSHIVIIMCAQELFPEDKLDLKTTSMKLTAYRDQIERISQKFPNSAWVLSFKGYEPIGGWGEVGVRVTKLYKRIEDSEVMQDQYVEFWHLAANVFKHTNHIAFNLMNEPEWTGFGGREKWLKLASRAASSIREVSPQRTLYLEGTNKSLIGRNSISSMVKPISFDNVIYGFHYYGNKEAAFDQGKSKLREVSIRGTEASTRKALNSISKFKQERKVPVALTEVGIVAKTEFTKGGVPEADRAAFAQEVLTPWREECQCGITWWALGDTNTPYRRLRDLKYPKSQAFPRTPDVALFKALKLTPQRPQ
jgi:hypothetical protein